VIVFLALALVPPGEKGLGLAVKFVTWRTERTQILGAPLRVVVKAIRPHASFIPNMSGASLMEFDLSVIARHCPFLVVDHQGRRGKEIACVIIEPVVGNMGTVAPEPGYLESLRSVTAASGTVLIFEEVCGPQTGDSDDADPAKRWAVRLTDVRQTDYLNRPLRDPLDGTLITTISWDAADALPFPLCISSTSDQGKSLSNVSVARGNIVLADHGLTEPLEALPDVDTSHGPYRPHLKNPRVTCSVAYDDKQARQQPAAGLLLQDVRQVLPVIVLKENGSTWSPRRDLLRAAQSISAARIPT